MLWYKCWLESRQRFLLSLSGLVLFSVLFAAYTSSRAARPISSKDHYFLLFVAHQYFVGFWMLSIVLLGMGGILQERAGGVSQFTLALPVNRRRLVSVRLGIFLVEAIALAVAPWIALVIAAHAKGQPWSLHQALYFDALLIGGGFVYVGLVSLVSSAIEGLYTAPVVAFGAVAIIQVLCNTVSWLKPFNFLRLAGGFNYVDPDTWLITKPFPWPEVLVSMALLACLFEASIRWIERREF
jgi:ABC-2 type transport system permease protein